MSENQLVEEFMAMESAGVSLGEGMLRGVRLLGAVSKTTEGTIRRRYTEQAMREAVPLYSGVRVNIDHPPNAHDPRRFGDRFGKVVEGSVRYDAQRGIVGDVAFNPHHPMAKTVAWWAEKMPEAVGFSHNADGDLRRGSDGVMEVAKITALRHVDLVADPATTGGLYESAADPAGVLATIRQRVTHGGSAAALMADVVAILEGSKGKDPGTPTEDTDMDLKTLTLEQLQAARPDLTDKISKTALDAKGDDEQRKALQEQVDALTKERDALKAKADAAERQAKVRTMCTEAKLPESAVTDLFVKQLVATATDEEAKALIEDRKALVGEGKTTKPKSGSKTVEESTASGDDKPKPTAKQIAEGLGIPLKE